MFGLQTATIAEDRSRKVSCPSLRASFQLLPDRRLRIVFLKRHLTSAVIQYYFGNDQFIVPSPFDLPADLLRILEIDHYRIHPGVYPVLEDSENFILDV